MWVGARRLLLRPLYRGMRRGLLAALLWGAGAAAALSQPVVVAARFEEPTTRYPHGVLGDDVEWGALVIVADGCVGCADQDRRSYRIRLPKTRVFEDLAPRVISANGKALVMVVESDASLGARLALYSPQGLFAATPFIGRSNRWLAPVGAGDFDGDGLTEFAFVDRPHLAKTLRIWRLVGDELQHVADFPGHTNHRIGWDHIPGGVRDCGHDPELITASADWRDVLMTRWDGRRYMTHSLGPYHSPDAMNAHLTC